MNRRDFIGTALAASALRTAPAFAAPTIPVRPNILFILADDLGYGDLSCYGRPDFQTPILDQMAAEGSRFTDNYASAPVCTPTRCAFHTGRYPHRLAIGMEEPLSDSSFAVGLPANHPTIGTLLRAAGYETVLIGKWHLGNLASFGPVQHGFDEFFGINGAGADYFTHKNTANQLDLYENLTPSSAQGYLTDLFTQRAISVISRPHSKPFFLSLQYNAPHWPWEGPDDGPATQGAPTANGGSTDTYGEMMRRMDSGIGQVMDALRAANLERNTLVVFTSDNGGERYSNNWPFPFQKLYLWEGGLRVPAIARWPGIVPVGVTSQVALTMDWTKTFLSLAGVSGSPSYPLDGEDLTSVITGTRAPFDRTVFWRLRSKPQHAARMGNWKYLKDGGTEHLFDLSNDPGETTDLKATQSAAFDTIRTEYAKWNSQMLSL